MFNTIQKNGKFNQEELIDQILSSGREESRYAALFRNHVAQALKIYSTDLECFEYLQAHGPAPVGVLSAMRGLSSGAMTSVIDRLETAGFVRREHDKKDRRKVFVFPTEEKADACSMYYGPYTDNIRSFLSKFSELELNAIVSFYQKLIVIDKSEIDKVKALNSKKKQNK